MNLELDLELDSLLIEGSCYSRIIVEIKGYKFVADGLACSGTKIRDLGVASCSVRRSVERFQW
jgi:hypothetical protein